MRVHATREIASSEGLSSINEDMMAKLKEITDDETIHKFVADLAVSDGIQKGG